MYIIGIIYCRIQDSKQYGKHTTGVGNPFLAFMVKSGRKLVGVAKKDKGENKEDQGEDISRLHTGCFHKSPCGKKTFCGSYHKMDGGSRGQGMFPAGMFKGFHNKYSCSEKMSCGIMKREWVLRNPHALLHTINKNIVVA